MKRKTIRRTLHSDEIYWMNKTREQGFIDLHKEWMVKLKKAGFVDVVGEAPLDAPTEFAPNGRMIEYVSPQKWENTNGDPFLGVSVAWSGSFDGELSQDGQTRKLELVDDWLDEMWGPGIRDYQFRQEVLREHDFGSRTHEKLIWQMHADDDLSAAEIEAKLPNGFKRDARTIDRTIKRIREEYAKKHYVFRRDEYLNRNKIKEAKRSRTVTRKTPQPATTRGTRVG